MNRMLLSAISLIAFAFLEQAKANDILLSCTLRPGNRLALGIGNGHVVKSGMPLQKLDPKSVAIGQGYITFNQSFKTYDNTWRINRATLKVSIKTVLKDNRRVVLDEKGSCANSPLSLHVNAKPVFSPSAALDLIRLR
jgi:hypothetical protein